MAGLLVSRLSRQSGSIDLLLLQLGLSDVAVENPPIRFHTITAQNL